MINRSNSEEPEQKYVISILKLHSGQYCVYLSDNPNSSTPKKRSTKVKPKGYQRIMYPPRGIKVGDKVNVFKEKHYSIDIIKIKS